MDKVQKGFSKVLFSGCYWLENNKLEKLLDAYSVLGDAHCMKVAKRFLDAPVYKGVFSISFQPMEERPYRVYEGGDDDIVVMNLLNGLIFKLKKGGIQMVPLGERFKVETMFFRSNNNGFERY